MQIDGKVYKVIFLEKATITECNLKIKQYSSDLYHKRYLWKKDWTGLFNNYWMRLSTIWRIIKPQVCRYQPKPKAEVDNGKLRAW
jgi:hypothetical protein